MDGMEDRRLLWTSLLNSQHISLVIVLGTWSLKAENKKYIEVHLSYEEVYCLKPKVNEFLVFAEK